MNYTVSIIVLKGYNLDIQANSEDEALDEVRDMSTQEIQEVGDLQFIESDYAEIVSSNED